MDISSPPGSPTTYRRFNSREENVFSRLTASRQTLHVEHQPTKGVISNYQGKVSPLILITLYKFMMMMWKKKPVARARKLFSRFKTSFIDILPVRHNWKYCKNKEPRRHENDSWFSSACRLLSRVKLCARAPILINIIFSDCSQGDIALHSRSRRSQ